MGEAHACVDLLTATLTLNGHNEIELCAMPRVIYGRIAAPYHKSQLLRESTVSAVSQGAAL